MSNPQKGLVTFCRILALLFNRATICHSSKIRRKLIWSLLAVNERFGLLRFTSVLRASNSSRDSRDLVLLEPNRKGVDSVAYKDLVAIVVDDYATMRRIIKNILKNLHFKEIIEAENGLEALRLLESNKVDLIVSGWDMPTMTGLELLKRVRADERLKRLPFLMVSAKAQKENIIEAIQAKVSNYVLKPFSPAAFAEKLAKIIPQGQ